MNEYNMMHATAPWPSRSAAAESVALLVAGSRTMTYAPM